MCGIAGIINAPTHAKTFLNQAVEKLQHRGPDHHHLYCNETQSVGLAHTRLKILDLTEAGDQPMCSEDQNLWITYNGEIYNHRELRKQLSANGYTFRSQSDTETLLALYQTMGPDCLEHLNGMFAFAIYDKQKEQLFCARDRLGIKPFYYLKQADHFAFASEIKALLEDPEYSRDVDWQAIWDYFSFGYVAHPRTAFKGIAQLPPGHMATLDLKRSEWQIKPYWSVWGNTEHDPKDKQAAHSELLALIADATELRTLSDVPLGCFLSGGIDSSLLTALLAKNTQQPVKTFTVTFEDAANDPQSDQYRAQEVSAHLGTDHTELRVEKPQPDTLKEIVHFTDQPFCNITLYLQHLIAQATREHVTVALAGVGADELFVGYPKYMAFPFASTLSKLPASLGQLGTKLFAQDHFPGASKLRRLFAGMGLPFSEQYLRWCHLLDESQKQNLLSLPNQAQLRPTHEHIEALLAEMPEATTHQKMLYLELQTFLANNLLEYTDKATMATALEARVPFLDHRVVEYAYAMPLQQKTQPFELKGILKEIAREFLPKSILNAPKQGFGPPGTSWLNNAFQSYFESETFQDKKHPWLSETTFQTMLQEHLSGKRSYAFELTALLMFDVWYNTYILDHT